MLVKNATERDITVRYSLNLFSEGKIAKINLDDLSLQRMEKPPQIATIDDVEKVVP
jgi:hypothetical protein